MTFLDLKLARPLTDALQQKGYVSPTPIQESAIPLILQGHDIFGCAQTGTGKTAAFTLPMLDRLLQQPLTKREIRVLILAPTRELALQISDNIKVYASKTQITHTTVFGGVSQHNQVKDLQRGVHILVATPGRLLDLMQQGFVRLQSLQFFVLDEADRMLDMGFINDINKIIPSLPATRQTLFFSATAAPDIVKLSEKLLRSPKRISVAPVSSATPLVEQSVYFVEKSNKRFLLKHLLKNESIPHALVFTRTKHGADKLVKDLNREGITSEAIHGNKSQGARERALKGFKNRSIRILVATDIASRGIDVQHLSHVINFELPEQPETYVHRIGRTGRAGATGRALSFCTSEERPYLRDISRLIKKEIPASEHPFAEIKQNNQYKPSARTQTTRTNEKRNR